MTTYARHRIRIAPDTKSHTPVLDSITGAAPLIWRGTSLQVEVGLFNGGVLQPDISNINTLYLAILDSTRLNPPILQVSLNAADLVGTLTADQWNTGDASKYHALFDLGYVATQLPLSADTVLQQKRTFWLVIHAVTSDSTPRRLTWGGCNLEVEEDGVQNELTTDPIYAPSVRVSSGTLQIYNKTTGRYHPIWFEGEDGHENIKWGAGVT